MYRLHATPLFGALVVTLGLLTAMQHLVGDGSRQLTKKMPNLRVDYVHQGRDEGVKTKSRAKPQRGEAPLQAWAPQIPLSTTAAAVPVQAPLRTSHDARPRLAMVGGPTLMQDVGSADAIPLVRVNPIYPPRAQARGVEGWVWLEFTITAAGTTTDIQILDAEPRGYFERAARLAVKKYTYKPMMADGRPVARPGVQVVLSFEMAEG